MSFICEVCKLNHPRRTGGYVVDQRKISTLSDVELKRATMVLMNPDLSDEQKDERLATMGINLERDFLIPEVTDKRPIKLVTETRSVEYYDAHGKLVGRGEEIVREIDVCSSCHPGMSMAEQMTRSGNDWARENIL